MESHEHVLVCISIMLIGNVNYKEKNIELK